MKCGSVRSTISMSDDSWSCWQRMRRLRRISNCGTPNVVENVDWALFQFNSSTHSSRCFKMLSTSHFATFCHISTLNSEETVYFFFFLLGAASSDARRGSDRQERQSWVPSLRFILRFRSTVNMLKSHHTLKNRKNIINCKITRNKYNVIQSTWSNK